MKYNPITVTDLNKYIKEKISDDEYLTSKRGNIKF